MIGRLRGLLAWKQPPYLLIDAHGVGYELEASLTTFQTLPEIGAEVTLLTHLAVREDAQKMVKLLDLLEDLDDTQNVYSNADIPDDILAKL